MLEPGANTGSHADRIPVLNNTAINGVGLGLRAPHFPVILEHTPPVPWFEVLIDNYMVDGGSVLHHLEQVSQHYALTFHGVGMSLGSTDPLDMIYLARLKSLIERFNPVYVSDHLCWSLIAGNCLHDLLPLPYINNIVAHVSDRIRQVQDTLGRRILLENVSGYLSYNISAMQEWEFLIEIAERADCDILLDINNIYVSARNHNFNASEYLLAIPPARVKEMHLAGYEDQGTHLLDTHGEPVYAPVWELYRKALSHFGPVPTLIEWDTNIPPFEVLYDEALKAKRMMHEVCLHVA